MSKFIAGDLVTLSAAGRKNQHNTSVYGHIGIVLDVGHGQHPYQIKWLGATGIAGRNDGKLPMAEYEIKFAKNGVVSCK